MTKLLLLVYISFITSCTPLENSVSSVVEIDLIKTSQDILKAIKNGENTDHYVDLLAQSTKEQLIAQLPTDQEKITFWVNIYNGFIQIKLRANPELYEKRNKFFAEKFISIGGYVLSFSNIEHGIIRRSQWLYGLGFISNPFAPRYQKNLRLDKTEARIHFALNCGARSCPPVTIYNPERLEEQLEYMSRSYIMDNSSYDSDLKTVNTTTLFSWFRGDFGGKRGIKRMLKHFDIIPDIDVKLEFGSYDWTLFLDNFVEVP